MRILSLLLLCITLFVLSCDVDAASTRADSIRSAPSKTSKKTHSKDDEDEVVDKRTVPFNKKVAVIGGAVLAFNSGFINGACLSGGVSPDGTPQAVAAVTGAWTTSAFGLAQGNFGLFAKQFKMILSYIFGSTIAGLLNEEPIPFEMARSSVLSFWIGSLLLFAASNLASKDVGNLYFYLAAIANGIQNSVTSVHTSNLIRTTHFTGISSDMGTFLGQVLRGNNANLERLKIFGILASSFWLGGFLSFFATQKFAAKSLLFSSILYFLVGTWVESRPVRILYQLVSNEIQTRRGNVVKIAEQVQARYERLRKEVPAGYEKLRKEMPARYENLRKEVLKKKEPTQTEKA